MAKVVVAGVARTPGGIGNLDHHIGDTVDRDMPNDAD